MIPINDFSAPTAGKACTRSLTALSWRCGRAASPPCRNVDWMAMARAGTAFAMPLTPPPQPAAYNSAWTWSAPANTTKDSASAVASMYRCVRATSPLES